MFRSLNERTVVFIDGSSVNHVLKNAGFKLDWAKLRDTIERSCRLQALNYYAKTWFENDEKDGDFEPIRPLLDWMGFNGYRVTVVEADERKNVIYTPDMIVDVMLAAPHTDRMIFFGGHPHLIRPMKYAQQYFNVNIAVGGVPKDGAPNVWDQASPAVRQVADFTFNMLEFFRMCAKGENGAKVR